jgi:hypothetical protein
MIEYSMDGQHSRSMMEIIAEKTHFLQSSSRLQMASSSEQREESSMMVRQVATSTILRLQYVEGVIRMKMMLTKKKRT